MIFYLSFLNKKKSIKNTNSNFTENSKQSTVELK